MVVASYLVSGLMAWGLVCVPASAYLLVSRRARDVAKVAARLAPVGAFYVVYAALIRWTANPRVVLRAYENGRGLIGAECRVHVCWEATLSHLSVPGATAYYDWAQLFVVVGVLSWVAVSCDRWQWRLARNALAVIAAGGFLCYWLVPMAPPWLLPASYGIHSAGLRSLTGVGELLGAFPSLHTAWAGWAAVVIWAQAGGRWWRWLGWVNLAITAVVVVCTGNHYVTDVVAGELLAFGGCAVADWWERALDRGSRLLVRVPV